VKLAEGYISLPLCEVSDVRMLTYIEAYGSLIGYVFSLVIGLPSGAV